jgi:hypothetical protein
LRDGELITQRSLQPFEEIIGTKKYRKYYLGAGPEPFATKNEEVSLA